MAHADFPFHWFVLIFVIGSLSILALLSSLGGWSVLAREFHSERNEAGIVLRFASMGLARWRFPISYGNCLFVRISAKGIQISIFPIFRPFHPKLFIPWERIKGCERVHIIFIKHTVVHLTNTKVRMFFAWKAGEIIYEEWKKRNPGG